MMLKIGILHKYERYTGVMRELQLMFSDQIPISTISGKWSKDEHGSNGPAVHLIGAGIPGQLQVRLG